MSARDRAKMRQMNEAMPGGREQEEVIALGIAPKSMIQRKERRDWLVANLSEALHTEASNALSAIGSTPNYAEDEIERTALAKLSAGLLGVEQLFDNPVQVKEKLPKLEALMEQGLEELVALKLWTRSPNSSKLSE